MGEGCAVSARRAGRKARSQFARETDRDLEEEIRSGQAQAGTCQDDRHLVAARAAVGIEVKGRVPATFRVPDAVDRCCCSAPGKGLIAGGVGVSRVRVKPFHIDDVEHLWRMPFEAQSVGGRTRDSSS